MPFSAANFLASGDAFTEPSAGAAATGAGDGAAGAGAGAAAGAGAGAASGAGAGAASSAGASAAGAEPPFNDSISSPSSPRIAKTVSTGDISPSPVPMYRRVPS